MLSKTHEDHHKKTQQGESRDGEDTAYIKGPHAAALSKAMYASGFAVMALNGYWVTAHEQNTVRQGGAETCGHTL